MFWGISRQVSTDRFRLLNIQAGHQPIEFLPRQVSGFRTVAWPAVSPFYCQPFVEENKTIAFLSEYSDKKGYLHTFVIRIFFSKA